MSATGASLGHGFGGRSKPQTTRTNKTKTISTMKVWELPLIVGQVIVMAGCWYLLFLSMTQGRDFIAGITPEGALRIRMQIGIMTMIVISYLCVMFTTVAWQAGHKLLAMIPLSLLMIIEPVSIVTSFTQYNKVNIENIQTEKEGSLGYAMNSRIAELQTNLADGLQSTMNDSPDDHITVATKAGKASAAVLNDARDTMALAESSATSASEETNTIMKDKYGIDWTWINLGFSVIQTVVPIGLTAFFTLLIGKRLIRIQSTSGETVIDDDEPEPEQETPKPKKRKGWLSR